MVSDSTPRRHKLGDGQATYSGRRTTVDWQCWSSVLADSGRGGARPSGAKCPQDALRVPALDFGDPLARGSVRRAFRTSLRPALPTEVEPLREAQSGHADEQQPEHWISP